MSKLINNNDFKEDNSHNQKAYEFINKHLPSTYVDLTINRIVEKGQSAPTKSLIRNVKNRTILRNDILLALVEVANENKLAIERINLLIS
ncbi:hypothetical protein HNP37_002564 [Flavobacterium nitrogenifigens]|uniref:Uncharacterized protein n=2 Tax=Flavobacterium TaxID=237 RepID=A0A7W7IXN2_9FLAO|nr:MULTISPECIES: hypothetical protein [Flavobacterium]MBB4802491.1 hypothetical protein [Flavobacterium nitrogenifigens]MBB6387449.1 hypothetical protein [Flavobacterium notoginsengisoli]